MKQKWNYVPFEDAVEIWDIKRKPINNAERASRINGKSNNELYPYYGATGQVGFIDDYLTDGEYVLLGEDGAPFLNPIAQKAYIVTGKTWVNNHAHVLKSKYNNKFLCYYLNSINYKDYVSGTTRLKLTQAQMKRILIPVPSIEEQERIVAKIEELFSELDNAVETLNATKAKLEVYRQAVLLKAFEPKNNWNIGKLGDVIQVLTDYHANGSYEILKQHVELLDTPDYALMIRSTNFEKNNFSNDLKYITKEAYDFLKKSQLFGDEVLMGKIGNAGKVYYMKDLNRPMSLAMNLFAMRFDHCVSSKYVYYFLNSAKSIEDIKKHVKGVGTPTINKNSVRDLYFAYPDTNEQKNIVTEVETKLSLYDSVNLTLDNILRQASAMRQSILKQAFEGRLL